MRPLPCCATPPASVSAHRRCRSSSFAATTTVLPTVAPSAAVLFDQGVTTLGGPFASTQPCAFAVGNLAACIALRLRAPFARALMARQHVRVNLLAHELTEQAGPPFA